MLTAIARQVSPRFPECELTFIERTPIDLELARLQHNNYIAVLKTLGCNVLELQSEPNLPDSVFVEDTAVVLPECAFITRPGAVSRRAEVSTIAAAMRPLRKLEYIDPPAMMDGGDVFVVGDKIYIGLSSRTDKKAIDQMKARVTRMGYDTEPVEFHNCLHLKSAITRLDDRTLLINPDWVDPGTFHAYNLITVDDTEPFAANCLPIGGTILFPSDYPETLDKIRSNGFTVRDLEFSEFAKAEGALTCCSLIIE